MTKDGQYDAIVVGAGFSGVYQLILLRQLGLRCVVIEAGSDFGGSWYWNRYPGARVDTHIPVYELSLPELWKEWTWREKFPGRQELQAYVYHFPRISSLDVLPFRLLGISGMWGIKWICADIVGLTRW